MFAYDVGILKHADRLEQARARIDLLSREFEELAAPQYP